MKIITVGILVTGMASMTFAQEMVSPKPNAAAGATNVQAAAAPKTAKTELSTPAETKPMAENAVPATAAAAPTQVTPASVTQTAETNANAVGVSALQGVVDRYEKEVDFLRSTMKRWNEKISVTVARRQEIEKKMADTKEKIAYLEREKASSNKSEISDRKNELSRAEKEFKSTNKELKTQLQHFQEEVRQDAKEAQKSVKESYEQALDKIQKTLD